MHILFTRFPLESAHGGAEIQTMNLAKGLREKGHTISFLGSCPILLKAFDAENFATTRLDIGKPPVTKWGAISFIWRQCRMKKNLINTLNRGSKTRSDCIRSKTHSDCKISSKNRAGLRPAVDTILMLSLSEKILLTNWAVKNNIKVFWVEHDRIGRWLTKNPWFPKLHTLSKFATIVTVSDLSRDLYTKLGFQNVVSIPNGIDVGKFTSASSFDSDHRILNGCSVSAQDDKEIFQIGCIARLSYEKGIDVLIQAIAPLNNVTLEIIGIGPDEMKIHTLIKQINEQTNKRINVTPSTSDPTLFYKEIDCLVLPSRDHDPFGLVVAEAMAAGIPTICTDTCGIAQHLNADESIIVEAGDVNALREAIIKIQNKDVWNQLSQKGFSAVHEKFSIEKMVEQYEELIQRS